MIYNFEQKSEAWHDVRAGRFTGTDFKSLFMGENTKGFTECISAVVASSLSAADDSPDISGIEAVARGSALEDFARKVLIEITGIEFIECGFVGHDDEKYEPWAGVSPDGIEVNDGAIMSGCEIKCPAAKTHLNYILDGELPKEYFHQVHGAMFVTGASHWYFMSYHPDMKPFILRVNRDEKIIEELTKKLDAAIAKAREIMEKYMSYEYETTIVEV